MEYQELVLSIVEKVLQEANISDEIAKEVLDRKKSAINRNTLMRELHRKEASLDKLNYSRKYPTHTSQDRQAKQARNAESAKRFDRDAEKLVAGAKRLQSWVERHKARSAKAKTASDQLREETQRNIINRTENPLK